MAGRTFIVRVSDAPRRVVVEDVRTQRTVVVPSLAAIAACIAGLLGDPPRDPAPSTPPAPVAREDSVSTPP
jgi:hypothetical protein